jgi:hypothetical protein
MITPEIFNRNELLRKKLAEAIDILELAFTAFDQEEAERMSDIKGDALVYSMVLAELKGISRLKRSIRNMAKTPKEELGPLEAGYNGVDPFSQLALDAEQEYKAKHPESKPRRSTTNKKP